MIMQTQIFQLFDLPHLTILSLIALVSIYLVWNASGKKNRLVCYIAGIFLLTCEIIFTIFAIYLGTWDYTWAIPLNLCDLALFAVVISLIYTIDWIWELAFFWVIIGSIPAVLTPDIAVSFPSPFYLLFFTAHGGAIISIFYLAIKQDMIINLKSVKRCWIITHIYVCLVFIFNLIFGTNYLFLLDKPFEVSPIDYMGPWPYYLFWLEIYFSVSLFIAYYMYRFIHPKKRM